MKVVMFGATGMVGRGVLHEALAASEVESVVTVGRGRTGVVHPKLREIEHANLFDIDPIASQLFGLDACLYSIGVSSVGMSEAEYRHLTHDLALAVARSLARTSPGLTFCFVSGQGAADDPSRGAMWARVKGQTEQDLRGLGFKGAYAFRPGLIKPMKGIRSKTGWYRLFYATVGHLFPKWLFPSHVTDSQTVGRAMLRVARDGFSQPVLRTREINQVGG